MLYDVCKSRGYISHNIYISLTKEGALRLDELKARLKNEELLRKTEYRAKLNTFISTVGLIVSVASLITSILALI